MNAIALLDRFKVRVPELDCLAAHYGAVKDVGDAIETIAVRCISYAKRYGLTRQHLTALFVVLTRPEIEAKVKYGSDLLAEFSQRAALLIAELERKKQADAQYHARINPALAESSRPALGGPSLLGNPYGEIQEKAHAQTEGSTQANGKARAEEERR